MAEANINRKPLCFVEPALASPRVRGDLQRRTWDEGLARRDQTLARRGSKTPTPQRVCRKISVNYKNPGTW